jgi:hypothetical protein
MGIIHHCVFPMVKAVGKWEFITHMLCYMGSLNPISFNNMHRLPSGLCFISSFMVHSHLMLNVNLGGILGGTQC